MRYQTVEPGNAVLSLRPVAVIEHQTHASLWGRAFCNFHSPFSISHFPLTSCRNGDRARVNLHLSGLFVSFVCFVVTLFASCRSPCPSARFWDRHLISEPIPEPSDGLECLRFTHISLRPISRCVAANVSFFAPVHRARETISLGSPRPGTPGRGAGWADKMSVRHADFASDFRCAQATTA